MTGTPTPEMSDPLVRVAPSIQRQIDAGKAALAGHMDAVKTNGVPRLELPAGPVEVNPSQPKTEDPPVEEGHDENAPPAQPPAPAPKPAGSEFTLDQALEALALSNQRLQTLQGKFNAEVPALSRQIAELKAELDGAKAELRRVSVPPNPENTPLTERPKQSKIKAEELENYGVDFFDVVGRRAAEIAEEIYLPQLQKLQTKVEELDGSVTTIGPDLQKAKLDRFSVYMDRNLDGWRDTDVSPQFIAWLNENHPLAMVPRMQFFQDAFNKEDFPRALSIYKGYLSEKGIAAPSPAPRPAQDTSKRLKLDTVAAPSARQRAGSVPLEPQAPQEITPSQVKTYYRDKARGLYVGRDAEVAEIEAAITRLAHRSATGQQPG